jgi:pimeloyl-ACP methyl ester carboxylesterase
MRAVFDRRLARIVYVAAAIVLALSLLAIRRGDRAVAHYAVTLEGGIPAVVYEPGPQRRWGETPPADVRHPVVVLAHGFAGNKGSVGVLARRLARAGYGVITFDFRGHGANRTPFRSGPRESLDEDLGAAIAYASGRPHFDPERLVLIGDSMGGGAVLDYASRWPGAAAVVSISGPRLPVGAHALPNTLLLWGGGEGRRMRARGREVGAELAGLERLVLDRTYGDPQRGSSVRLSEVPGATHIGVLYRDDAARRVIDWLRDTVGGSAEPVRSDGRLLWAGLGALAAGVLMFGAPALVRTLLVSGSRDQPLHPGSLLLSLAGAHVAALLLLGAADPRRGGGPLGLLPLPVAREMVAFFLLSGLAFLAILVLRGRALPPLLPRPGAVPAAIGIALVGYVLLVTVLAPFWDVRLAPHRLVWGGVSALVSMPFFLATETSLRGAGRAGLWVGPVGKFLTLGGLGVGAALGALPFFVGITLGPLVFLFVLFELVGLRLARITPDPWPAVLVQGLWVGWFSAALFPL